MSLSTARSRVESIQREMQSLQRKVANLDRDLASKSSRIASINKSISKSTNLLTLDSRRREIQRLQDEISRLQDKKANVSKEVANQTERLHRAQQELYKAQDKEQKRSFDTIVSQGKARDRSLLDQLRKSVTTPRNPTSRVTRVNSQYDAFIAHATEDKNDLVRPLAERLKAIGHAIWYDEFELRVGDSLRQSIDRGLASSRFGIVVLSPSFFAKNWAQYELNGLVAKEMTGGKVILPLWHKVSKDEVMQYSPSLADKIALSTASYTIEELAAELSKVLRNT